MDKAVIDVDHSVLVEKGGGRGAAGCRHANQGSTPGNSLPSRIPQAGEPCPRRLGDRLRVPQRRFTPIGDIFQYPANAFLEGNLGLPAKFNADAGDVGPGAIGFARPLRDLNDFTLEQLDQPVDGLRSAGADIVDPADPWSCLVQARRRSVSTTSANAGEGWRRLV